MFALDPPFLDQSPSDRPVDLHRQTCLEHPGLFQDSSRTLPGVLSMDMLETFGQLEGSGLLYTKKTKHLTLGIPG